MQPILTVSRSPATDAMTYRLGAWVLVIGSGVAWWSSSSYAVWFIEVGSA